MELLKSISIMWSMLHALVLFILLFVPRYDKKKTMTIILFTVVPLVVVNFLIFMFIGLEKYGMLMVLTLTVPFCIVFWFLSKYRGGRYFFTFCMVNTVVVEIIYLTSILNFYIAPDRYIFTFLIRILIFPVIEFVMYKKFRPMFLQVKKKVNKGWGMFSLIGVLSYAAIILLVNYPTYITTRTENIAVLAIMFILIPLIYVDIIITLYRQQNVQEVIAQENILKMQVSNLAVRMDEIAEVDEKFRVERHNFRHKLKTIASLIKTEQYDECLNLLAEYVEPLDKTKIKRYCQHAVLDAVLASYIKKAKGNDIKIDVGLSFPDVIPVNEAELATAIANALENAINACEKLAPENRFIQIKVIDHPAFVIRIINSFEGSVEFDDEDIPINNSNEHGFGTRYIAAFCQKYNGFYEFRADNGMFSLDLNF
ncbi:MAG: GHKL domain-containing protein [Ruminococcaceae bacterium]|nr:GHKL domain-containing protein [Oscillospiraceae bacterium]